jgi:hypothetical protein
MIDQARWLALPAVALIALSGIGQANDKTPPKQIIVFEGAPPDGCEKLDRVVGKHVSSPLRPEEARKHALDQASDLGATHFQSDPDGSRQFGSFTVFFIGVAYRCRGPDAAPAPGK